MTHLGLLKLFEVILFDVTPHQCIVVGETNGPVNYLHRVKFTLTDGSKGFSINDVMQI